MSSQTQIYTSASSRSTVPERISTQSRYSSDTVFSHKTSSSTTKTSEAAITRRNSTTSHKHSTSVPRTPAPKPPKDVVVHSIQAFGPTTADSMTCTPAATSPARNLSRDALLDAFPFPPGSPVAGGHGNSTIDEESIRFVMEVEDEDDDVIEEERDDELSEMPHFPTPPERTFSQGTGMPPPSYPIPEIPPKVDSIISASIRVSVPEKRSFFSRSHSHHSPQTKTITMSMPRSSYERHFAYDPETHAYIGTQSYRLWSMEEVEARYSKYKGMALSVAPMQPPAPMTRGATVIGNVALTANHASMARKLSSETVRSQRSLSNMGSNTGGAGVPMGLVRPMTPTCIVSNAPGLGIHGLPEREKERKGLLKRMTSSMSLQAKSSAGSTHTAGSRRTSTDTSDHALEPRDSLTSTTLPEAPQHAKHTPLIPTSPNPETQTSPALTTNTLTPTSTRSTSTITPSTTKVLTPMVTKLSPTPTMSSTSSAPSYSSRPTLSSRRHTETSQVSNKDKKTKKREKDHADSLAGLKLKNGSTLRSGVGDGLYGIVLSDKTPSRDKEKEKEKEREKKEREKRRREEGKVRDRGYSEEDDGDLPWSRRGEETGALEIWVQTTIVVESVRIDGAVQAGGGGGGAGVGVAGF